MALTLPASPSVGQTASANGRQYVYVGNNVWELVAASGGGMNAMIRTILFGT